MTDDTFKACSEILVYFSIPMILTVILDTIFKNENVWLTATGKEAYIILSIMLIGIAIFYYFIMPKLQEKYGKVKNEG